MGKKLKQKDVDGEDERHQALSLSGIMKDHSGFTQFSCFNVLICQLDLGSVDPTQTDRDGDEI